MTLQTMLISGLIALLAPAGYLFAQDKPGDRDTTPHSIRLVAVESISPVALAPIASDS